MSETAHPLNLRQMLMLIKDHRELHAHLCLDTGCQLAVQDPQLLIKAINSITDYLRSLSDQEMTIDLDAHRDKDQLVFIIHTSKLVAPEMNPEIRRAIEACGGLMESEFVAEKYCKVQLTFLRTIQNSKFNNS